MAREERARVTFEKIENGTLLVTLADHTRRQCATTITPFSASAVTRRNDDEVMMSVVIGDEWPGSMPDEWPGVEVSTFANGQYLLDARLPNEADGMDALRAVDRMLFMLRVLGKCDLHLSYNARADIDRSVRETFELRNRLREMVRRMEDKLATEEATGEIERVYRLIEAADRRRDEVVLCLLGTPGIGKTESVERFARDHNRDVVHIIASQIMPNEVSGMTMPNQETHSMEIFDHEKLGHLKDGDIIFFDELLKGQQQVLNACLTLIQERRLMSGKRLPDVLIIAAANPLGSAKQLPIEIRQRFLFVNVDWDAEEWSRYMRESHGITPTEELIENLQEVYSMCRKGDSSTWNTLTPRTATKLMLWVDAVHDDYDLMMSVSDEIGDAFGIDVKNSVVQSVMDKYDVTKKFLSGINEILKEVDTDSATLRERVDNIRDNGLNKDTMQQLVDSLMALDEWPRISEMLKSIKLDDLDL